MVDMNRDGVKDILMNSFDGNMVLFDGETLESCGSTPAPGYFNDDDVLDFMIHWSFGAWPYYNSTDTVIVDGRDGTVLWNMTTVKYDVTSDLIARTGAKNRDVFLFRAQGRRGRDPMERGAIHGATGIQRVAEPWLQVTRREVGDKLYELQEREADTQSTGTKLQDLTFDNFLNNKQGPHGADYVECESDQTVYIAEFFALDRTTMAQPIKLHHFRTLQSDAQRQKVDYEIRQMRRGDLDGLYALLAENKWNMERDYLECVFDTDPSGLLVVVTEDDHIIVTVSILFQDNNGILAHGDHVASSGMNIVKEQYRELGIGRELFKRVMGVMRERNVGGTSLSNRISFYAQFGWTIPSYTLHYNQGPVNPDFINTQPKVDGLKIVPVTEELFEDVLGYDSELHTVPRPKYLHNWVMFHKAKSFAALKNGKVCGYSVLRPSDVGFKMYPLFADDKNVAHALFCKMASFVPDGQDVIFTQPIENEEATKFVEANKFTNYLSMTRLYNKWNIDVDVKRVFSTSSTKYAIV
nr:hypothetical protein BaRGS_033223 [Batillaria attramentaria]